MKILLSLALAALPAFSLTLTFDGTIPRLFQNIEISAGGNVINTSAGQLGVRIDDTFPALMYCADPLTWLLIGPTPVSTITENLFPNGSRLAWLYNTYNPTLTQGWEAAALQLAIWEVVLDNNNDALNAGQLQVTANTDAQVAALAGSMLAASSSMSSTGITFFVPTQGVNYSQTLFQSSAIQLTAVPEPANALLFGVGLLMMGAIRFRRRP